MFHPSLLVSIGNTEMFDKFSASMWLSWLGSRVGRILEYICIIISVTEKAGNFPTQWVATWLGRESIQFDHWSWNIELFSSVLLFSILLASLSLQFSTELSLWVHLIICRASSHSWRQFFTLALECFTLQLVVVVYLFVYSLIYSVVYSFVYLVVYMVVHSSKQLSPLIKACNPISPFSFFPRVVLTSRRCGFFRTTVLGVRICSTIIVLENYICGCGRPIRQFPREGRGHTHITHQPNRDVGESEPDCQHCNKHQLTALRQILCVCYICRDGDRYCTNRVSCFIVVTLVDFPSQSNIQTDIPTLDS